MQYNFQKVLKKTFLIIHRTYTQGAYVDNARHYFYYVDHEGQLFLDDARIKNFTSCFKGTGCPISKLYPKFLTFFLRGLKHNNTDYNDQFPYISTCMGEINYLRCDDTPYVFTKLDRDSLCWTVNNSNRKVNFEPSRLCMFSNGRLYHPAPFADYGLVRSAIAEEFFHRFEFDDQGIPIRFSWENRQIPLTNELLVFSNN